METHYQQAKRALSELVTQLGSEGRSQLPAEGRLTEMLGFSRATIRAALQALQMEGKLQRLHGIGTLINRHALTMEANLAEDSPFVELLETLGYSPSLDVVSMEESVLSAAMCERLELEQDTKALIISRLFRASGKPAVLSRDYVPLDIVDGLTANLNAEESTFEFFRKQVGIEVRYSVAEIQATNPGLPTTGLLDLPPDTPLLLLDHLHIDKNDKPIGITQAFVNDTYIRFSVVRSLV